MMRIRTVKPELLKHEDLFELEHQTKLPFIRAWIGLFCAADREGRFKWKPRALKSDITPFDNIDFSEILNALWREGFLLKYEVRGEEYGVIPNFHEHQRVRADENKSQLPAPESPNVKILVHNQATPKALRLRDDFVTPQSRERDDDVTEPEEFPENETEDPSRGRRKEEERKGTGTGKEVEEERKVGEFEPHPLLAGDPTLAEVLQAISPSVQKTWVQRYELNWLKNSLLNAIQHHLEKENATSVAQIRDWGKRLVKWLRYEKKPRLLNSTKSDEALIAEFEAEIQKNGGNR